MAFRSRLVSVLLLALSWSYVLADESLALPATVIDQFSTARVSNSPAAHVGDDQYDGQLGAKQHWFAPSNTYAEFRINEDEEDAQEEPEKRKPKIAGFRSDLGKRLEDNAEEYEEHPDKRAYRMRGGKAFKADLGKRGRGGSSLFRSDLGKRFDSVRRDIDADISAEDNEDNVMKTTQRRGSMFRSDLGKRSAKLEPVRRMFKADLGKRRMQFRHDLG